MSVRDLHPLNAQSPIDVILSGIVMSVRDLHPSNAQSPIDVILSGIVMLVIEVLPSNALAYISFTGSPLYIYEIVTSSEGNVLTPFRT